MPARIVSFNARLDPIGAHAAVQPEFQIRLPNGEYVKLPQLPDCPVIFPGGGGWSITWDLVPGDHVALLVADRELGRWRTFGTDVEPGDTRRHNLGDAIVMPGLNPNTLAPSTPVGNMVLQNDAGTVKIVLEPAKIIVDALAIELTEGATEALLKGGAFASFFDLHTHPVPAFGTSGPPTVLTTTLPPGLIESLKVKTG